MTNGADNITLKQVQDLRTLMPDLAARVDMELVTCYDDFVDCVSWTVDSIVRFMEANPGIRSEDSEDRLTEDVILGLNQRGFDASHDTMHGGHTDICVRHKQGFTWLAEAKIHKDYDYLLQGFNQLCTRYANGAPNCNKGALLIYIRVQDAKAVMAKWQTHLAAQALPAYSAQKCPARGSYAFLSSHTHTGSGSPYTVRHIGVLQYFDPQDHRKKNLNPCSPKLTPFSQV